MNPPTGQSSAGIEAGKTSFYVGNRNVYCCAIETKKIYEIACLANCMVSFGNTLVFVYVKWGFLTNIFLHS